MSLELVREEEVLRSAEVMYMKEDIKRNRMIGFVDMFGVYIY
jgi:hypothetical protein